VALFGLVLFLGLAIVGAGFAFHALWYVAGVILLVWLLGFVIRPTVDGNRGRWYRW
jgi:hypothetical protein